MNKKIGIGAVLVIVGVLVWGVLGAGGGSDCKLLAEWERNVGSTSPFPERITAGTYEHIELLLCGGGNVRAVVQEYKVTRSKQ